MIDIESETRHSYDDLAAVAIPVGADPTGRCPARRTTRRRRPRWPMPAAFTPTVRSDRNVEEMPYVVQYYSDFLRRNSSGPIRSGRRPNATWAKRLIDERALAAWQETRADPHTSAGPPPGTPT
jgi:hypothetical protein